MSDAVRKIRIQGLTREAYQPFGWVLGGPPDPRSPDYFDGGSTTFWAEHDLQVGKGGEVQLVWVHYKGHGFDILHLESHRLTEQAIIPVTGNAIVHVVCPPPGDPMASGIVPDLTLMQAFLLDGSKGVCMRRGCWHTHFALGDKAVYLMITRRSTTEDILEEKRSRAQTAETVVCELSDLSSAAHELVL